MQDFRKLRVWQAGHLLTLDVYKVTQAFPKAELYGLTSQLRRASVSIAANIAEGTARRTDRGTRYFLEIAQASATEVEYLLLLSHELNLMATVQHADLSDRAQRVRRMLNVFMARLKRTA